MAVFPPTDGHEAELHERGPLTGPELARLRFDSLEARLRAQEITNSLQERRIGDLETIVHRLLNGTHGETSEA